MRNHRLFQLVILFYSFCLYGQNNNKTEESPFYFKVDSSDSDISYYKYYTFLDNTPSDTIFIDLVDYKIDSIENESIYIEKYGEEDKADYIIEAPYRDKFKNIKIDTSAFIYVSKAKSALIIAKIYLIEKYGESHIKKNEPYHVVLVDDKYWQVFGTLPVGYLGGVPEILISKYDGRVIYCIHGV